MVNDVIKTLKVENVALTDITPYAKNAKLHPDEQVAQIAASIKAFGFNDPIAVGEDGVIIEGHGRLLAAQRLGLETVPVIRLDHLNENERRAYVLAHNKLTMNSGFDSDMLKIEFNELDLSGFDLSLTGFDDAEIEGLSLADGVEPPAEDPDELPEAPEQPFTQLGDVYEIGNHRLMCGDSTILTEVEKLMDGQKAGMVFTDPPYGISHSGKGITAGGVKGNNFGEIIGDSDISTAVEVFNLCLGVFKNSTLVFWGANYYCSAIPNGFGWIVWDKQREGNTFSGAELAFINKGVRVDIFRHMWHGMVKASEQGQARVHPTQKPVALADWCFSTYEAGPNILDLFGGSGSTMVAAHMSGRKSFLMELDPHYCDVVVARMRRLWPDLPVKHNGVLI